jgi:hypothetical protein
VDNCSNDVGRVLSSFMIMKLTCTYNTFFYILRPCGVLTHYNLWIQKTQSAGYFFCCCIPVNLLQWLWSFDFEYRSISNILTDSWTHPHPHSRFPMSSLIFVIHVQVSYTWTIIYKIDQETMWSFRLSNNWRTNQENHINLIVQTQVCHCYSMECIRKVWEKTRVFSSSKWRQRDIEVWLQHFCWHAKAQ